MKIYVRSEKTVLSKREFPNFTLLWVSRCIDVTVSRLLLLLYFALSSPFSADSTVAVLVEATKLAKELKKKNN